MSNNLIISYDLYEPNKDYEAVAKAIKSLGNWAHVQKSVWYVKSNYSASAAAENAGLAPEVVDLNLDEIFEAYVIGRKDEQPDSQPAVERMA